MMIFLIFVMILIFIGLVFALAGFVKSVIDLKKAEKYRDELFDEFTK